MRYHISRIFTCYNRLFITLAVLLVLCLTGSRARATEGGGSAYSGGNEDFIAGQHMGPWNFGLNGYIYKQITDDDPDGDTVDDNKGQCVSVGPAVQ